jgi:small subunit ribosomal protein S1
VLEVDQNQSRLLFSERDAKQDRRSRRLEELEEGQVISGNVVNIVDFGAFIDLDGIDGLIHISELDWERIDHPSEVVSVGEEVEVKVMEVDADRERVSLSRKARLPSPWQKVQEKYKPGDLVRGTVNNVRDFGAFVEIPEGVVGLVHVSEIGFGGSGNPKELVKRGDTVLCRIVDIEPEKERMSLSMQRVTYEEQIAWMVENMEEGDRPTEVSQFAAAMQEAVKEEATEAGAEQERSMEMPDVEAELEAEEEQVTEVPEAEAEVEIEAAEQAATEGETEEETEEEETEEEENGK